MTSLLYPTKPFLPKTTKFRNISPFLDHVSSTIQMLTTNINNVTFGRRKTPMVCCAFDTAALNFGSFRPQLKLEWLLLEPTVGWLLFFLPQTEQFDHPIVRLPIRAVHFWTSEIYLDHVIVCIFTFTRFQTMLFRYWFTECREMHLQGSKQTNKSCVSTIEKLTASAN